MNSDFNPDKFKVDQRKSWDSVARGWQKWWQTFENGAQHVSDRLIELAGIRPGNRVLDIATGIGEPAVSAAKVVGKGGHVTATDMSTEMLAIAEERSRSLGLDDIMNFKQSDAENLQLGTNHTFDAILCRWGLMFLPNLSNALVKIHQMLLPGRKLAVAVWSEPSKVPLINIPMSTAREYLRDSLVGQAVPGPFSLADVHLNLIRQRTIRNSIRISFHIFEHYWLTKLKREKRKYGMLLLIRLNYYLLTIKVAT